MKKVIIFSIALFFIVACIKPSIIESDNFELVLDNADADTLVIFDIDNTIGRYENEIGNDEWFCYLIDQKITEGYDKRSAILLSLPLAYYAHFYLPMVLTNNTLPTIINNIIKQYINVIALTSRGMFLAERTHEQLKSLNITFFMDHNFTQKDLILYLSQNPCLYRHGIIFTGNNDKGETLLSFLKALKYYPKKIIFIDDKIHHIRSVEAALQNTNIEYIGIRYTGCDHYINHFNATKADIQLQLFKQLHGI